MKKFVAEHPVWFVVIVSVFVVLLGFVIRFAATMCQSSPQVIRLASAN